MEIDHSTTSSCAYVPALCGHVSPAPRIFVGAGPDQMINYETQMMNRMEHADRRDGLDLRRAEREKAITRNRERIARSLKAIMYERGITESRLRREWSNVTGKPRGATSIKNVLQGRKYNIDTLLFIMQVLGTDLKEL